MSSPVTVVRDAGLATVTFDSPPLNLFDNAMMDALSAAITALEDDLPRAVLLCANGRVVSGGVDVGAVFAGTTAAEGEELWHRWLVEIARLEALPVPTVFAAHALCLTAAFEVALACDLLLAARSAKFGLVEIVVGLTPSMGGPQRLSSRAGPARARELIMTGELFDAETLHRWGVVNRVYEDAVFRDESVAFVKRLAAGPTRAHAATKAIIRTQVAEGVAAADAATPQLSAALFETEDLKRAVRSFVDDGPGKATFDGR